jgi:hypothetical protein
LLASLREGGLDLKMLQSSAARTRLTNPSVAPPSIRRITATTSCSVRTN